jgi:predicted DNA binding CopG/RHH family protein
MSDELTPEEQEIEDNVERAQPVNDQTRERVERILHRARKNQSISLRLPKEDLELTKRRAAKAGLPYQTLISSIIHKYVTDQLYERDEVRKIIRELQEERTSPKQ